MKPLLAKYNIQDHLISEVTSKHSYFVEFEVKFDNGFIEKIRLNTNSNFQDLIGCDKINRGKFFESTPIVPWHKTLLNCWNNRNQDPTSSYLYTFQEVDNNTFACAASPASKEDLENTFSIPESKPWCAIS